MEDDLKGGSFSSSIGVSLESFKMPIGNCEFMLNNGLCELMSARSEIQAELLMLIGLEKTKNNRDQDVLNTNKDAYGDKIKVLNIKESKIYYNDMHKTQFYEVKAYVQKL